MTSTARPAHRAWRPAAPRALYSACNGPLYRVRRASDGATANAGLLAAGGYGNAAEQDVFCARTTCVITGGNSQSGGLTTFWNGSLPSGYAPMHQEGAIVLGTGGGGDNDAIGLFFESVMTAGFPSDSADAAVQADI